MAESAKTLTNRNGSSAYESPKATLTYITQNDKAVLCVVRDGDGTVVMTIDENVTYSGLYLAGDQVIYAQKKGERQIQNLSC